MLKEEFIKEQYENYLDSILYLNAAVKSEFGSRATLGYVLLNKDKQPKQCMNSSMFPITDGQEISKYNSMRVLPSDIIVQGGNKLFKKVTGDFWGKHTEQSIVSIMERKEFSDLNAIGTGKYLVVVDIDTKNINSKTPTLEAIEKLLPKTFIVETPSGGKHYYFIIRKGQENPRSSTLPCIDILGKGKLVVTPGQEREGKGMYEADTENPNFSYDLAYWNESIRSVLESLFSVNASPIHSKDTLPLVYLDTETNSGKTQDSAKVDSGKSYTPEWIKELVNASLSSGAELKIEVGSRANALFYYCAKVADRTPAEKLLETATSFNKTYMSEPLKDKEVESIVKSCLKKFSVYSGNRPQVSATETKLDSQLKTILSSVSKSEFQAKIEDITPAIQSFYERAFGKKYTKSIPTSEVGKRLRAAGFEKKKIQKGGVRAWLWNINPEDLLNAVEAAYAESQTQAADEVELNPESLLPPPGGSAEPAVNSNDSMELGIKGKAYKPYSESEKKLDKVSRAAKKIIPHHLHLLYQNQFVS